MKAQIFCLLTILCFAFYSCDKDELEFSCDPEINEYVDKNKKKLRIISLDELNNYDISLQRAVFNSWDPSRKRDAWLTKLNSLLVTQDLSIYERVHIEKLIDHISIDYFFDYDLTHRPDEYYKFAKEWISFAKDDLQWRNEFIAFVVYRLYTDPNQFYLETSGIIDISKTITTHSETYNCNCSTSSDFCFTGVCNSGNCNSVGGCGWLWSMDCNGNCY